MLILTERTPNPAALKFTPPEPLPLAGRWSFDRDDPEPARSPLARRLLAIEGVRHVFIAPEFITVLRDPDGADWGGLKYAVLEAIAEHLASGAPAVEEAAEPSGAAAEAGVEAEIREVLARQVQPGVARDGGEIVFDRFDPATGVLWIRMQGACGGCPSARLTLKAGVEQVVRRYVPEVLAVAEAVSDAAPEPPASGFRKWLSWAGAGEGRGGRPIFTHGGAEIRPAARSKG